MDQMDQNTTPRTALASGRGKSEDLLKANYEKANYENHFTTNLKHDLFQEKKVYRQALDEIRENLDEWFRGGKFFNSGLGRNDGEFLASEIKNIVGTAMGEDGDGNSKIWEVI